MTFLSPAFLLLGLLAIPILLLYMLKLRRQPVEVSSTLLWQLLLRDLQANTPWQRLRRNIFLLLQLLALAALVLALANPSLLTPSLLADFTVVILDGSASMAATDVAPSRFEAARSRALRLIDEIGPGDRMTILLAGPQPRVLVSTSADKAQLRQAVAGAEAGFASVDWPASLSLAAASAASAGSGSAIVLLSDGGLSGESLPPLPVPLRYVPIGESSSNLAVSALALRPSPTGAHLFVRVSNFADEEKDALLSLYADGNLFHAELLRLNPGSEASLAPATPPQTRRVEARLTAPPGADSGLDHLPLDDAAYAVLPTANERRVLLYPSSLSPTGYNLFAEKALLSLPQVTVFRALPRPTGELAPPMDSFDIHVLDGLLPETLPAGNLLIFDPPSNSLFAVGERAPVSGQIQVVEDRRTRYVDWHDVHVLGAKQVELPDWATVLVEAEGQPLVFTGERDDRRLVVFTFDLHDSDLPLQVTFPILMANLVDDLAPPFPFEAGGAFRPGEPVNMAPTFEVQQVTVTTPLGIQHQIQPHPEGFTFDATGDPGFYQVDFTTQDQMFPEYFAVNLFDPLESDIRPSADPPVVMSSGTADSRTDPGMRSLWPWLATLALAVLMFEWWLYHERQSVASLLRRLRRMGLGSRA